jgi:hypothetical protein
MLIDYLTLNYIFSYFWIAIRLFYQLFIHACSEANFRENYFFCKFSSEFQIFSVKRPDGLALLFGRMQSCRLLIWQVDCPDTLVAHLDTILTGFYPSLSFFAIFTTLHFFYSCHFVCVFLANFTRDFGILCTFLLIPW